MDVKLFSNQRCLACSMYFIIKTNHSYGYSWADMIIRPSNSLGSLLRDQTYHDIIFNAAIIKAEYRSNVELIKYILQYIPRNMHTVLLCFALLWLCNRS